MFQIEHTAFYKCTLYVHNCITYHMYIMYVLIHEHATVVSHVCIMYMYIYNVHICMYHA